MAFINEFTFAPGEWLPLQDQEMLDRIALLNLTEHQGKHFENPEFEARVVYDVHTYFAMDLFWRIRKSDMENQKLVMILPSPENAVFISLAEGLNRFSVSARNVHVFFLYEYANEKGEVAPWQSPYSRSGHFMRYFYQRLNPELRMPLEQIHFFATGQVEAYSDLLAAEGGADVAYTALSWSGGIGAIDPESYPAATMEEFLQMGSRLVIPMPEMLAHDSMRGMFGCSGDIGNVPPRAATVGPKDLAAARERVDVEYLTACGGTPALQKFAVKAALFGPLAPENPGSMLRLFPGICYIGEDVAKKAVYTQDDSDLIETLKKIQQEEGCA